MNVTDESLLAGGERALLQTAVVKVTPRWSKRQISLRLLFDSGSHRSYISQEAVQRMGAKPTRSETISVNTFGAKKPKNVETKIVEISLELEDKSALTIVANMVPTISASIRRQPLDLSKYSKILHNLKLADTFLKEQEETTIDILIGSDYYMDLLTFEKKEIGDGLHLLGSKFGWILTGRTPKATDAIEDHSMLILNTTNQSLLALSRFSHPDKSFPISQNTEDFWNLETIGITDPNEDVCDEEAIKNFNNTIEYKDNRYMVKWPWREQHRDLPSNFDLSIARLKSLVRRLSEKPEFMEKYNNIIQDQLSKKIIEKANYHDETMLTHYIPHQAVLTPQKTTTKVRIVYDASSKTKRASLSLNECLLRGPVILENLCGLLMKFRLHKIGVVADIEKAFLQVGLQKPDRDVVRFLWLKDPSKHTLDNNLQVYRFCRVPFGVISSPFLLAATIQHHLQQEGSSIAKEISDHMYVDNMITGVASSEEALKLYKKGKSLFERASMNLREWTSNCEEFTHQVLEKDRCSDSCAKVLGMTWNVKKDTLCYGQIAPMVLNDTVTKRQLFKKIAKWFDPLGFAAPALIRGKIMLQELWSQGLKWDDQLSREQAAKWKHLVQDLETLSTIVIPRFSDIELELGNKTLPSLVCFCDASAKAYASCIYLRWTDKDGNQNVSLMFAKSRLAPLKRQTIPRLELLAVLIGVRSLKFVEQQLCIPIARRYLWSDSQCVLDWIHSTKLQPVFIHNRLKEIQHNKNLIFGHVKSEENPADLPSRGISVAESKNCTLWWKGPQWLTLDERTWCNFRPAVREDISFPTVGPSVLFETSLLTHQDMERFSTPFGIDKTSYSKLSKLLRVTSWCNRFIAKARKRSECCCNSLTAEEIFSARKQWEKSVQRDNFAEVLDAISNSQKNELVSKLDLSLDNEGLLRCGGRLSHADLNENAKRPKLLPKMDHFTTLVVEDIHRKVHHAGVSHTLAHVRQEYWLPQGRRRIQTIMRKCLICKRWEGGPYKVPPMPPFPKSRVSKTAPFSYTGLDYFGPLYVKTKQQQSKVWVCLYTCMTIRAVHMELVSDLSAEEFLLSFRRFVSRRGCPKQVFSDNATNFQAASKIVTMSWKDAVMNSDVNSYFSTMGIHWRFIPQSAPWMGGFYERLVGVVKRSLRKTLGKICWTSVQLQTIVAEVEVVVNSRPLVYVENEMIQGYPLCPSHFLSLNPDVGIPAHRTPTQEDRYDPDYEPDSTSHDALLRLWKKGQTHLDRFWNTWHQQYLTRLRERSQRLLKQPRSVNDSSPKLNDVVLVKDDILPRGSWKIAKITELLYYMVQMDFVVQPG